MEDGNLSSESTDKRNRARLWIPSQRGALKCIDKPLVWSVRFSPCPSFIIVIEFLFLRLEGKKGSILFSSINPWSLIILCCNFESKEAFCGMGEWRKKGDLNRALLSILAHAKKPVCSLMIGVCRNWLAYNKEKWWFGKHCISKVQHASPELQKMAVSGDVMGFGNSPGSLIVSTICWCFFMLEGSEKENKNLENKKEI